MEEEASQLDSLKEESNSGHGGKREGAGRKPGSQNAETLEKNRVLKAVKERIQKNADRLLNAAFTVALGASYLYVIRKDEKGKKQKAELITSPQTIQQYLDGELDGLQDEYYFITTERPDTSAIRDLYDRAFGKAEQAVKGTLDVNFNAIIESLDNEFDPAELAEDQV